MSALSAILRSLQGGRVAFWCPGCHEAHQVGVGQGPGPRWGYNGNPDAPTFTPSILVRGTRSDLTDEQIDRIFEEHKTLDERERLLAERRRATVCHSFVTDGRIRFLGDCTHDLAGQTVDLPEWPG